MRDHDNWGWRARIGIFIVASEPVPEAEWWAMAPDGVSIHASRVAASAPWATVTEAPNKVSLAADLQRGLEHFATMKLTSVVIAHSSSSMLGGAGWDDAVVKSLKAQLPAETAASTNGLDCIAELKRREVKRPFLVFPAWFSEDLVQKGIAYFSASGLTPVAHLRVDPGPGWRDLAPAELYPAGAAFAQNVEALYTQVRESCPWQSDGVIFVGTGLRCFSILQTLEADLDRPVISANAASLKAALQLARIGLRSR